MATNFAGILSRKAERTVNTNENANASQVSNPEVAVAVMPEPKPKRVTNRREAVAELKHRAEEVAPMAAPAQPAPAPAQAAPTPQAPKAEAATKPKAKRTAKAKATAKPMAAPAPQAEEKPRLTIMKYSDKCLALFGDTKPIKEQLKKLGGRYNPHLHPFGQDTSVPGWVFPMKCRAELEKMVG